MPNGEIPLHVAGPVRAELESNRRVISWLVKEIVKQRHITTGIYEPVVIVPLTVITGELNVSYVGVTSSDSGDIQFTLPR